MGAGYGEDAIDAGQSPPGEDFARMAQGLGVEVKSLMMAGDAGAGTRAMPEIDLRAVHFADGPSSVSRFRPEGDYPLLAPCATAIGASWNPNLAFRVGQALGDEARRRGVSLLMGPNINLERSPLAGRAFEYFSEDPLHTGLMAAGWLRGVQSREVGTCIKHLVCNDSETERQTMSAVVSERALREVYLLPFEIGVAAGAWSLMTAYNRCNGVYCSELPIVTSLVKNEWGFDGLVVSDFYGTHDTLALAASGLDCEMPGPPRQFGPKLAAAVKAGQVPEERLNDSTARLLRLAHRVGALGPERPGPEPLSALEVKEILTGAAAEGFVLLKNDGVLPLAPQSVRSLAVLGPNAATPCYQGGAVGQTPVNPDNLTPLQALQDAYPGVRHEPGAEIAWRMPPWWSVDIRPSPDATACGMRMDYFAGPRAEGQPLASEVRSRASTVWFGPMPGIGLVDGAKACVRASGTFTAHRGGGHVLHVGGSGDFRIIVDGRLIATKAEALGADTMGDLLWPDLIDVPLDLGDGQSIEVSVEMTLSPARAQSLHVAFRPPPRQGLLEKAIAAASQADAVVLVVGETQFSAMEAVDRSTTKLDRPQVELIEAVCAANPRTVVVVNAAHAVDMPWADKAAAVMMAWFPGEQFAPALADVLTGRREPGGRLPVTIAMREDDYPAFDLTPKNGQVVYSEDVLIGYRSFDASGAAPRFAFGHGLGYGQVVFEGVSAAPCAEGAEVSVRLHNRSDRRTKTVVQTYIRAKDDPLSPARLLKAFEAVYLDPGARETAVLSLDRRAFAHWSVDEGGWRIRPGRFEILIGRSAADVDTVVQLDVDADGRCRAA